MEITYLSVVRYFLNDFGRHPKGRADNGIPLGQRRIQLGRHAKIGKLRLSFFCEKNVSRFDVLRVTGLQRIDSMDLLMRVQIGNAQQYRGQEILDFSLAEDSAFFINRIC